MRKLLRRLRYWISSAHADSELAEEIEVHRALKQEKLESEGLSRADAAAASRRALGNVTRAREQSRDVWAWAWLDGLALDIRYACRSILRMPVLAAVVILSLGVGIGVNAAVFSWVQAVVLQPLPGVTNPSAFYLVEARADTGAYPGVSWPEYRDLRERLRSFRDLFAFRMTPLNVGEAGNTEQRYAQLVSDNYFSGLELEAAAGRLMRPGQASSSDEPVVISHGFWKARFNGASNAIGQTLRVNDRVLTIVGVLPEGFQGTVLGVDFDMWLPASLAPVLFSGSRELDERSQRGYTVMGRLQAGRNPAQAQDEVHAAMRDLARAYPETNARIEGELLPYWRAPRGPQRFLVSGLAVLQGLMLLLLLAVCGNTANLLLARATGRAREIGTRLAIGATSWRLVRLLMTENLIMGLLGAALGAVIALWGTQALRAVPLFMFVPIRFQTGVDGTGLLFSIVLGVLSAALFGAAPAFQMVRGNPHAKMRVTAMSAPRSRLRNALMGVEAAITILVLVAAALFFESFQDTRSMDPGFRREGVLLAAYDLAGGGAGHLQVGGSVDPVISRDFADKLLQRLRALPNVESAAIATSVPLDIHGLPMRTFTVEGGMASAGSEPQRALINIVTPDYFRAMQIPQLDGPGFAPLADRETPPQAVVNEEFVRRYIAPAQTIGRRLQFGRDSYVIAGVVKNSFYDAFGEAPIPFVYFSYRDRARPSGQIHLRTRAGAENLLVSEVRAVVRDLEPAMPIFNVRTLTEHVETNLFLRRIPARLFVGLGPLLLLFAAVGIYSVVAYNVAHRVMEIGIRIALGATRRGVVLDIVGGTMRVIALGAVAGVLVAFVVYIHVAPGGPVNPAVFVGVPAILLLVAAIACGMPARRAARIDPIIALREQ